MRLWVALTLVCLVCWGTWSVCPKKATEHGLDFASIAVTAWCGQVTIAAVAASMARFQIRWHPRGSRWALAGGLFGMTGSLSFVTAQNVGGQAAIVTPLSALYPVVTLLLAVAFLGERLARHQLIGAGLSLASIGLLSAGNSAHSTSVATADPDPASAWWLFWTLSAMIAWGLWAFCPKKAQSHGLGPVSIAATQILGNVPILVVAAAIQGFQLHLFDRGGSLYAYFGGMAGITGALAYFTALQRGGPASVVAPLSGTYPLVTVLLGYFFLDERLSAMQLAAVPLAVSAIALLSFPPRATKSSED